MQKIKENTHTHLFIDICDSRELYYILFTPKSENQEDWYEEIPDTEENRMIIDFDYDEYMDVYDYLDECDIEDEDELDNDDWCVINERAIKSYLIEKYSSIQYVLFREDDEWTEVQKY